MAELYPFSNRTVELLRVMPGPGATHRWLPRVAGSLRHLLSADECFAFLRECCDEGVTHRVIPDSEIEDAVDFAYSDSSRQRINFGRGAVDWPEASPALIAEVLAQTPACFDATADTGLATAQVLPRLFRPAELICAGRTKERALVRPLEEFLPDAEFMQFIVLNPMRGLSALSSRRMPSARCQNNVGQRRYLVAEFDDRTLSKPQQAQLITRLAQYVALVMVVDSGGKSLHAWFRVDHLGSKDQARFFTLACLMGADPSRWDLCGWLRMPGGLRVENGVPSIRQRILHFNPGAANA